MREIKPSEAEESDQEETQQPNLESYLRDNIFGDDFRVYDEKLQKLTQELQETRKSITDVEARLVSELSEIKEQHGNIPDNIVQRVDTRIDELISRSENDIDKLSQLINEFATEFQAKIEELQTQSQTMQTNNQVDKNSLADALIRIGSQLKNEDAE
ncbi:hypothetical protein JT359_19550 [Candidatus Poribacteria bacterium]|nr:hypothetical protein [Candidatus Poribacteria bacterium]